jgi:DNA-directed RNA polymerase specialized sigma24 family protein
VWWTARDAAVDEAAALAAVVSVLDDLPSAQREVVTLRDVEG